MGLESGQRRRSFRMVQRTKSGPDVPSRAQGQFFPQDPACPAYPREQSRPHRVPVNAIGADLDCGTLLPPPPWRRRPPMGANMERTEGALDMSVHPGGRWLGGDASRGREAIAGLGGSHVGFWGDRVSLAGSMDFAHGLGTLEQRSARLSLSAALLPRKGGRGVFGSLGLRAAEAGPPAGDGSATARARSSRGRSFAPSSSSRSPRGGSGARSGSSASCRPRPTGSRSSCSSAPEGAERRGPSSGSGSERRQCWSHASSAAPGPETPAHPP